MRLQYIICYDRQAPTAWVEFDNPAPLGGTSNGAIPTDDPEILAKTEELNALIAAKLSLTRADPPAAPDPVPAG